MMAFFAAVCAIPLVALVLGICRLKTRWPLGVAYMSIPFVTVGTYLLGQPVAHAITVLHYAPGIQTAVIYAHEGRALPRNEDERYSVSRTLPTLASYNCCDRLDGSAFIVYDEQPKSASTPARIFRFVGFGRCEKSIEDLGNHYYYVLAIC